MAESVGYNEATIRDHLARDLSVIEEGLVLIDTEYELPNMFGSKGFIDILARDTNGIIVVIELKRSNTAARQCIHELFKYTGLLAQNHGMRIDQVRCIAVSTVWHELLLPFSELYNSQSLQIAGYDLKVDKSGRPKSAVKVDPLPPQAGMELCPEHILFLHETHMSRLDAIQKIQSNCEKLNIPDYVLVELNHVKNHPDVIHPFATLVAFPLMSVHQHAVAHPQVLEKYDEDCRYPLETAMSIAIQEDVEYDSLEISYPDKFVNITIGRSWRTGAWYNGGKLAIGPLRSKQLVFSEIAGFDSGLGTLFVQQVSPGNHAAWRRFRNHLDLHTTWCAGWREELFRFLDELEGQDVTVNVLSYTPDDMLWGLHEAFVRGDPRYIPSVEVIVSNGSGFVDALVGGINWTGKMISADLDRFVCDTFGDFEGYIWARHFNEQRSFEAAVCDFFGLEYCIGRYRDAAMPSFIDLQTYSVQNARIIDALRRLFETFPMLGRANLN